MSGPPSRTAVDVPTDEQVLETVARLPPCFLREYVSYAATQSDAPAIFHVGTGLSILSVMLPPQAYLWGAGSPLYGNLFTLLVGSSALARKSTAISTAEYLLKQVDPHSVSLPPGSYEGLLTALALQPQQLVIESEFSRFLSQAQGQNYLNALKLGYVDLYDCKATGRKLSRETTEVLEPRLSLLAAIAPTYIEQYLEPHDLTGGFISRFFVCYGVRTEYRRPQPFHRDRFMALMQMIAHRKYAMPNAPAALSPTSDDQYWTWYEHLDGIAREADERKAGLIARTGTLARKITLILGLDILAQHIQGFEVSNGQPRPQVGGNFAYTLPDLALQFATVVAGWHYRSSMSLVDGLAPDADMRLRRDVLRTIRAIYGQTKMGATEGQLASRTQTTLRRLRPIMETLAAEGEVLHVAGHTQGKVYMLSEHFQPNSPFAGAGATTSFAPGDE